MDLGFLHIAYQAPSDLTEEERDSIWSIFDTVVDTTRDTHEESLDQMDEVFVVRKKKKIVGFGGIRFLEVEFDGKPHLLIYTGRVFFDPSVRSRLIAPRAGLRTYFKQLVRKPFRPSYWFFASATLSSYIVLTKSFQTCWPRQGFAWPKKEEYLRDRGIDMLARNLQPNPQTGAYRHEGVIYKPTIARQAKNRKETELIRYYRQINPLRSEGEAVFCMAPLNLSNWISVFSYSIPRAISRAMLKRKSISPGQPAASDR